LAKPARDAKILFRNVVERYPDDIKWPADWYVLAMRRTVHDVDAEDEQSGSSR